MHNLNFHEEPEIFLLWEVARIYAPQNVQAVPLQSYIIILKEVANGFEKFNLLSKSCNCQKKVRNVTVLQGFFKKLCTFSPKKYSEKTSFLVLNSYLLIEQYT